MHIFHTSLHLQGIQREKELKLLQGQSLFKNLGEGRLGGEFKHGAILWGYNRGSDGRLPVMKSSVLAHQTYDT